MVDKGANVVLLAAFVSVWAALLALSLIYGFNVHPYLLVFLVPSTIHYVLKFNFRFRNLAVALFVLLNVAYVFFYTLPNFGKKISAQSEIALRYHRIAWEEIEKVEIKGIIVMEKEYVGDITILNKDVVKKFAGALGGPDGFRTGPGKGDYDCHYLITFLIDGKPYPLSFHKTRVKKHDPMDIEYGVKQKFVYRYLIPNSLVLPGNLDYKMNLKKVNESTYICDELVPLLMKYADPVILSGKGRDQVYVIPRKP